MINEDCELIKSEIANNSELAHTISAFCVRIAEVRNLFIMRTVKAEDELPEIFADNQDLLLSASIGQLRRPIANFTNAEGEVRLAADARQALAFSIQSFEHEASETLKRIYRDWKEEISVLVPS